MDIRNAWFQYVWKEYLSVRIEFQLIFFQSPYWKKSFHSKIQERELPVLIWFPSGSEAKTFSSFTISKSLEIRGINSLSLYTSTNVLLHRRLIAYVQNGMLFKIVETQAIETTWTRKIATNFCLFSIDLSGTRWTVLLCSVSWNRISFDIYIKFEITSNAIWRPKKPHTLVVTLYHFIYFFSLSFVFHSNVCECLDVIVAQHGEALRIPK